ncbi:cysteine proteinase, partial [Lentithecium fluviatile CBS 122367]
MNVPEDKVYIFNTHFFSTLTRRVPGQKGSINYSAVARWTSKDDLFGYDYIVVPINQDAHWYLALICNAPNIARTPAIEDTESLAKPDPETAVRALKDYIREEGRDKRGMDAVITQNAFYAKSDQIPLQENFSDCGVYLLGYTQKFFEDPDRFKNRLLSGQM